MEFYISTNNAILCNADNEQDVIIDNLHLIHENAEIRSSFFPKIKSFLQTLRDELTVVIETDYVDKVYRDSYYTLYSTKLRDYYRNCVRLSFFSPEFNEKTELIPNNFEQIKKAYLGFLVIRPLAECCIGRNVISPIAKKAALADMEICSTRIASTCMGLKMDAIGFPHSSQDAESMSCAETTVWAILEYFGNKYSEYSPVKASDILMSLKPLTYERQLPSGGLTFEQISSTLKQQGFGCKVYEKENPKFKEIFSCYIESGIPLAVCIQTPEFGHAVVCIGRKKTSRDIVNRATPTDIFGRNFYIWNKCIEQFIFNDDNYPCYQQATFDNPTAYYGTPDWDNGKITHFIVPLHPKVYLDAELAIEASNYLAKNKLNAPNDSVLRTFLASNRTYREYLMTNLDLGAKEKESYLQIDMPKFVWVTEIANKDDFLSNKISGLILLDATGSNIDNEGYSSLLFYQINGDATFFNKESRWFEKISLSLPNKIQSFNGNLK